ncbi:MAG: NTP transferase domain-containing protein [Rhodoferax sp.]|jgi:hypothetical protein|nr:NTP transferase domain-containing protein [Rhodoferax sp.]
MAAARSGLTLLVLAAGQGTRFGGLKQIEPVGPEGETLLDYAVHDALRAGFGRVVFVVGTAFADRFRDSVASRYAGQLDVACVCQQPDDLPAGFRPPPGRSRPWGTLHAVWSARAALDQPFVVINADDFYGREAYQRLAGFLGQGDEPGDGPQSCAMVAFALQRTLSGSGGVNRGICTVADGWMQGVVEHTGIQALPHGAGCEGTGPDGRRVALRADAVASMNIWGFAPGILAPMGDFLADFLGSHLASPDAECYLPSFVNHAIARGIVRCRVLPTAGAWFGLTYAQDKPACMAAIRALVDIGEYPRPG